MILALPLALAALVFLSLSSMAAHVK